MKLNPVKQSSTYTSVCVGVFAACVLLFLPLYMPNGFIGVTVTVVGEDTTISFWAPHFSTYAIQPVVAADPAAPTPAPANTKNVVKKTGADMNTTTVLLMTAALVLGGLTVCGTVVAVKKLGVNK